MRKFNDFLNESKKEFNFEKISSKENLFQIIDKIKSAESKQSSIDIDQYSLHSMLLEGKDKVYLSTALSPKFYGSFKELYRNANFVENQEDADWILSNSNSKYSILIKGETDKKPNSYIRFGYRGPYEYSSDFYKLGLISKKEFETLSGKFKMFPADQMYSNGTIGFPPFQEKLVNIQDGIIYCHDKGINLDSLFTKYNKIVYFSIVSKCFEKNKHLLGKSEFDSGELDPDVALGMLASVDKSNTEVAIEILKQVSIRNILKEIIKKYSEIYYDAHYVRFALVNNSTLFASPSVFSERLRVLDPIFSQLSHGSFFDFLCSFQEKLKKFKLLTSELESFMADEASKFAKHLFLQNK